MKQKILLSIIMTTILVATSVMAATDNTSCNISGSLDDYYPIEISKKIWDGEEWVDEIHADIEETLRFNLTITYKKTGVPQGYKAIDIQVIDMLPECLEYAGNANYDESYIFGKEIYWNLTCDYEIELLDNESISIEFDAYVIGYGEDINHAKVYATERCSGVLLYGDAEALIIVEENGEPYIEVFKQVWNSDNNSWVEEINKVNKNKPVRFQIKITYHGEEPMKCLDVTDYLPEKCLIYDGNDEYIYPNSLIDDPDKWVSSDKKEVNWDWKNKAFYLEDGETIKIRFDAKVTEYCCNWVYNWVFVKIWGCTTYYEGSDCARVKCCPPDWEFEKKVKDPLFNKWVELAHVNVGDIITYKIDFTYYGDENLTELQIIDELPCVILYNGNANVEETSVSDDLKKTWWNLTEINIEDSETFSIIFDAVVTGQTGDCKECGTNHAYYYANEKHGEDTAQVKSTYKEPSEYCIKIKSGYNKVSAVIKNIGETGSGGFNYSITVNGGILKRINAEGNGTIENIAPGESTTVKTNGSIKRGIGRITAQVDIYKNGSEEPILTKTAKGFIIGRLIIIRPLKS